VGKPIDTVRIAVSGAGAAAISVLDLFVALGAQADNILVCDSKGVIHDQREDALAGRLDESKRRYCRRTHARTLADAVRGADVFLGCSAPGVLSAAMVQTMAERPIILALANPEPEIRPEVARAAVRRSNTIIGSLMLRLGDADALICGLVGTYTTRLERIDAILGRQPGASLFAALDAVNTDRGPIFITDTYVNEDPSAEQLAEIAALAVLEVQRFGIVHKVAFLSHSTSGSSKRASARKMRAARDLFVAATPTSNATASCTATQRSTPGFGNAS